jgi:hypothetical protein
MIGFLIGTLCLIGLAKTVRRARYGYYGHGCGGHGCGPSLGPSHGPWGHDPYRGPAHGPWGGPRHHRGWGNPNPWGAPDAAQAMDPAKLWLRGLFERLGTTPGQERVILEAVTALRGQGTELRGAAESTGAAASKAFRADSFDVAVLGDAFAKQSMAVESAQKSVVEALHKVHEALDERQRRVLADMLDHGLDLFGRTHHV